MKGERIFAFTISNCTLHHVITATYIVLVSLARLT